MSHDEEESGEEIDDLPAHEREPWWPHDEDMHLLTLCALQFDGVRYEETLARGAVPEATYEKLGELWDSHYARTMEPPSDPLHNFAMFFLLQRRLSWGGGLDRREAMLLVRLFLHLHATPVPRGYEDRKWSAAYESSRIEAIALAERLRPLIPVLPTP